MKSCKPNERTIADPLPQLNTLPCQVSKEGLAPNTKKFNQKIETPKDREKLKSYQKYRGRSRRSCRRCRVDPSIRQLSWIGWGSRICSTQNNNSSFVSRCTTNFSFCSKNEQLVVVFQNKEMKRANPKNILQLYM